MKAVDNNLAHLPDEQTSSLLFHRLGDLEDCLYLQLYYWGRDVIHPKGNQLVSYGFRRIAKTSKEGTSRYQFPLDNGMIELHGWCMGWYSPEQPGFVFVRKRHRLFFWDSGETPQPEHLEKATLRAPESVEDWVKMASLLQKCVSWVLHYETVNEHKNGTKYRRRMFHQYEKLPNAKRWMPPDVQREWLRLFMENPCTVPSARRFWKDRQKNVNSEKSKICCPAFTPAFRTTPALRLS